MNKKITHKKAICMINIALTVAFLINLNAFIEYIRIEKPNTITFYNTYQDLKITPQVALASENDTNTPKSAVIWSTASISAYTARESETDEDPFTNASNQRVKEGDLACPKKYAFGTKIEIKDLGIFVCQDRMNLRYRDQENFDIFMWDLEEAYQFGRQELQYRVLDNNNT